jgi:prolyl 4-hydroxylase
MSDRAFEEFERRAEAGEADAQYALAAVFAQRGLIDRAQHWLARAAEQGHADAIYTIAGRLLTITEGAIERRAEAVAGLETARERGSLAALRTLAALTAAGFIGESGWPGALAMMREACERGEPASKREIAALLFNAAADDEDGAALLREAATKDALAAALISRRDRRRIATPAGAPSLDRAFGKLENSSAPPVGEEVCARPRACAWRGALGVDLCDHLMGAALPRLRREQVLGADGRRRTDPHRTSWGAMLGFGFADMPAVFAGRRLAQIAGIPYLHGEPLSILRYLPGQEYRPHYDFLTANDPDLAAHGQRLKTALLYLNDGYQGGETRFLKPGLSFAGRTGDVLVFDNVDETGAPDYDTIHAGLGVERGEKWLASLWLRDQPFAG